MCVSTVRLDTHCETVLIPFPAMTKAPMAFIILMQRPHNGAYCRKTKNGVDAIISRAVISHSLVRGFICAPRKETKKQKNSLFKSIQME